MPLTTTMFTNAAECWYCILWTYTCDGSTFWTHIEQHTFVFYQFHRSEMLVLVGHLWKRRLYVTRRFSCGWLFCLFHQSSKRRSEIWHPSHKMKETHSIQAMSCLTKTWPLSCLWGQFRRSNETCKTSSNRMMTYEKRGEPWRDRLPDFIFGRLKWSSTKMPMNYSISICTAVRNPSWGSLQKYYVQKLRTCT